MGLYSYDAQIPYKGYRGMTYGWTWANSRREARARIRQKYPGCDVRRLHLARWSFAGKAKPRAIGRALQHTSEE